MNNIDDVLKIKKKKRIKAKSVVYSTGLLLTLAKIKKKKKPSLEDQIKENS